MEMTACDVCGKIFAATGRAVCPDCRKLLDIIYEKARTYLRDNPQEKIRAAELAEAIGEELRLVEIIVAEGRFDSQNISEDDPEEKKRKRLLDEFQKNLSGKQEKAAKRVTYGQTRHGRTDN